MYIAISGGQDMTPAQWERCKALLIHLDSESIDSDPMGQFNPSACEARITGDPDQPGIAEALSGDEREECWEAMKIEIESLMKRKTWTVVDRPDYRRAA